ncbi:diguanylate cyclase domain-containing protein [cf. Phormidesmis sp. LEGE 11477]|uniref:sensor domain-containing diguanylate cyclase n=1 Tax=cf. Phormidesmis sp. LEGE 11477 TaxID=1828680 RepID=UPI00187F61A3|nr:diguanylate cyclase [cf. Phormidesmis sp. LEGE 11477]MBE9062828.1 diguanylate cyclase [cf. Phormidesmis sp. LEGE 11477]
MELTSPSSKDSIAEALVPISSFAPVSPDIEQLSPDIEQLSPDILLLPGKLPQHYLQYLSQHPVLHSGDLEKAAGAITQAAAHILKIDRASLWLCSAPDAFVLFDRYDRALDTHDKGTLLKPRDHVPYFETLSSRTELLVEDISQLTSSISHPISYLIQTGLIDQWSGAFLELPIRCRGVVVGALWCECQQTRRWTALENANATSIALLAATAVDSQQRSLLIETLNQQHRQLRRETIEREQAEDAWQESQRFIQGIIDASTNILYVDSFGDGSNFYVNRWIENVLGYEPHEMQQLGARYLEQLVHADERQLLIQERRRLSTIKDGEVVENEYRFRHRQGHWRWLLCRETVFQRDYEGRPLQVFGTATDITKRKRAEVALQDFNQELERLAKMDGLTQVANRRCFDEYIEQTWESHSSKASLSLILCDIDYFKSFNDTYGHQAGDLCLKQVAKAIEQSVGRSTDLVARYGGEEFAVILPDTSVIGAERVAEKIRATVRLLDIVHSESKVSDRITLSLGIASISSTQKIDLDRLIAAADQGLYNAKSNGRDCFCVGEIEY